MDWEFAGVRAAKDGTIKSVTYRNEESLRVTITWDWQDEDLSDPPAYVPAKVEVSRLSGSGRLTARDLRVVPLSSLVENAFADAEKFMAMRDEIDPPREREKRQKQTDRARQDPLGKLSKTAADARLNWPKRDLSKVFGPITEVYNDAVARQQPATNAVADYMMLSRATAGRIIAKAREAGYPIVSPVPYASRRKETKDNGQGETAAGETREGHD